MNNLQEHAIRLSLLFALLLSFGKKLFLLFLNNLDLVLFISCFISKFSSFSGVSKQSLQEWSEVKKNKTIRF